MTALSQCFRIDFENGLTLYCAREGSNLMEIPSNGMCDRIVIEKGVREWYTMMQVLPNLCRNNANLYLEQLRNKVIFLD